VSLESSVIAGTPGPLLERSGQLEALDDLWALVAGSRGGRLVFVRGEAGAGKSTLVRRFCERRPRVLWGACDALFAPPALGPFLDIASVAGGGLEARVATGGRPYDVLEALRHELERGRTPVVVIEDVHWADEATLDVLRLLGRRIESVRALVIATYRDDELGREHPLRVVVGALATVRGIARVDVPPLSAEAVDELAAPYGVDGRELYRVTGGNPFFVVEALTAGSVEIPGTVREAVLARVALLSVAARALLDPLAVMRPGADLSLLEALAGGAIDQLDECLASGVVVPAADGVAFRHELERMVIEESLAPHHRKALHARALEFLAQASGSLDLARLAHHAEAAGDAAAVLRYAPAAAERASALGAHRESAALYDSAVRFATRLVPEHEAELRERAGYECSVSDRNHAAIAQLEQALAIRRRVGDRNGEAEALRLLSEAFWCVGRIAEARSAAGKATELLEESGRGRELAAAYCRLSTLSSYEGDRDGAHVWGERAIGLARSLEETQIVLDARINIAQVDGLACDEDSQPRLWRCFEEARTADFEELACKAITNLAWIARLRRDVQAARRAIAVGLEYVSERGRERPRSYLLCYRAQMDLAGGVWDAATETAAEVLRSDQASVLPRVMASIVLGLVRARRGDPGADEALNAAAALVERSEGLGGEQVAAGRAELAWLEHDRDGVERLTAAALASDEAAVSPLAIADLVIWRRRAGLAVDLCPEELGGPHALELSGDSAGAAAAWRELGCPYEAALAVLNSGDIDALRAAREVLVALGARPAAAILAQRLREHGGRVTTGPRPRTRDNPAGLTARELEVLPLLAEGLRNTEIADRLVVSPKTVDHHVSAILRKLDVKTRVQAATEAVRRGLLNQG
jgi:DNA-binding CsgD family transcriptional regulator/tetratricopeptide (TPR) repeat protein